MPERMSDDAYVVLTNRLADLEGRGRAEVADAIRQARQFGDLAVNAEYQFALDEQAHLEARIGRLRDRLESAIVMHSAELSAGVVRVASLVELEDENGERLRFRIAAPHPDAVTATLDSPLGRVALGTRVGDILEVDAPCGPWRARIVALQS